MMMSDKREPSRRMPPVMTTREPTRLAACPLRASLDFSVFAPAQGQAEHCHARRQRIEQSSGAFAMSHAPLAVPDWSSAQDAAAQAVKPAHTHWQAGRQTSTSACNKCSWHSTLLGGICFRQHGATSVLSQAVIVVGRHARSLLLGRRLCCCCICLVRLHACRELQATAVDHT